MFDRITRDHVRLAFEQAETEGVETIQINYLYHNGKKYPVQQIVRLAYGIAYGILAPNFVPNQVIPVLKRLGFETYRTDGPGPDAKNQTESPTFTWVPFYREMCPQLLQYSPAELISLIKQVRATENQVGVNDRDADGNVMELADMDPYTFLSFINKTGDTKRLAALTRLRDIMNLTTPAPVDVHGLPTAQAQSVWMFGYAYIRKPDDIDHLRTLYEQVENEALTAEQFEQVLKIYKVGPAKLTEALFCQKPTEFLPINGQTKPWLKKRGLPFRYENFAEYRQILDAVRQYDTRPFYEISREAYLENNTSAQPVQTKYYCVGITLGDQGDQLPRFVKEGIWQNGYGDEREKYLEVIKAIPVGSKLAAKSSFTRGPRGDAESVLEIKAIGEVTANSGDGQTLEVVWDEDVEPFTLPGKGYYRKTVQEVTRAEDIQLIFFHQPDQPTEPMPFPEPRYSKNIILYGPPGTGKTYETIDLAVDIVDGQKDPSHKVNKARFDQLRKEGQIEFVTFHQNYTYEDFVIGLKPDVDGEDLKFQRSYGIFYRMAKRARNNYEASRAGGKQGRTKPFDQVLAEFIEPLTAGGSITLNLKQGGKFIITGYSERSLYYRNTNGTTHSLSKANVEAVYRAGGDFSGDLFSYINPIVEQLRQLSHEDVLTEWQNYVLIIDEINRANMSRVFGELITLLEDDKRLGGDNELTVTLPSGELFAVPPNLYLIGTMNTADKSLALLDIALRRRFEFMGKYPNYDVVDGPAKSVLERLNKAILAHHKPADFLIGHAYFIDKQPDQLPGVFNNRVVPLLMEYFNGRIDLVKTVLKDAGIESERHPLTDQLTVSHVD